MDKNVAILENANSSRNKRANKIKMKIKINIHSQNQKPTFTKCADATKRERRSKRRNNNIFWERTKNNNEKYGIQLECREPMQQEQQSNIIKARIL